MHHVWANYTQYNATYIFLFFPSCAEHINYMLHSYNIMLTCELNTC